MDINFSSFPSVSCEELARQQRTTSNQITASLQSIQKISHEPGIFRFPLVRAATLVEIESPAESELTVIEKIFRQTASQRIDDCLRRLYLKNICFDDLDLMNLFMSLLAVEEESIELFSAYFEKEMLTCQTIKDRASLYESSEDVGSPGTIALPAKTAEAFQLLRFAYVYFNDPVTGMQGITLRSFSQKDIHYVKSLCESKNIETSKLAKIINFSNTILRIKIEIEQILIPKISEKLALLERIYKQNKGAKEILSFVVPVFLMLNVEATQKALTQVRTADHSIFLQKGISLIALFKKNKTAQSALYQELFGRITAKAANLNTRDKIQVFKFRTVRNSQYFTDETLPLPKEYLKEAEVFKETLVKSPKKTKNHPSKKNNKITHKQPIKKENSSKIEHQTHPSGEDWLTKPIEFVLSERVCRWLRLAPGEGAPYAMHIPPSPVEAENVRIRHAFPTLVDQVTHLDEYVTKNEDKSRLYAIAQLDYHDGRQERGIIGWGLQKTAEKIVCYHRYFTPHTLEEIIAHNFKKAFFTSDFPTLSEALTPPKVISLRDEKETKVARTELLDILIFDDLKNQTRISVFPLETKIS